MFCELNDVQYTGLILSHANLMPEFLKFSMPSIYPSASQSHEPSLIEHLSIWLFINTSFVKTTQRISAVGHFRIDPLIRTEPMSILNSN